MTLNCLKKNYKSIDTIFSLEHAAPVLRDMMQKISGTSQEAFWKANARNFLENELYPSLQQKPTDAQVRTWQDEPYKGNTPYPKQKIHRSPGRVWVRAKSELLIKSELEHYMIPHKYDRNGTLDMQQVERIMKMLLM